jgi:O-antigen/teichoic acid export membrane protein
MTSTASTAVLGLGFWALAARTYPAADVGAASAAVSAASLVAVAAQLNLTAVFTRFVPVAGAYTTQFVARGYLATILLAAGGSAAFAWSGVADGYLGTSLAARAAFVALAVLLLLSAVQDAVLTGLRRSGTVLVENAAFALAKLALLGACALFAVPQGILIGWLVCLAVAVLAISVGLFGVWLPRHARAATLSTETLPDRRRLASFVAAEYVKSLLTILAPTVIPLVVVAQLGTRENAYLAVPWMVNAAIVGLFYNVSAAFVVEAAHGEPMHPGAVRGLIGLMGAVAAIGLVVGAVLPRLLLGVLGADYAAHGSELLRLLSLALPLEAVTAVYSTLAWLDRRLWHLTALQGANAGILLGATAVLLPRVGLPGVGWAYLTASFVIGLCSIRPAVHRLRSAARDHRLAQVEDLTGDDAGTPLPELTAAADDDAPGEAATLTDPDAGPDGRDGADPQVVGVVTGRG